MHQSDQWNPTTQPFVRGRRGFVAAHARARSARRPARGFNDAREFFSRVSARDVARDVARETSREVERDVVGRNSNRASAEFARAMSPVRRSRRVAATARTRGNGVGNNPLVDLTNRGGAAQSSGANTGVKAARGRRANGVGAREGNPRGVKREATSSEGRTRKKTKKDDFMCRETMPETRGTRAVTTHCRRDDDDVLKFFEIFEKRLTTTTRAQRREPCRAMRGAWWRRIARIIRSACAEDVGGRN